MRTGVERWIRTAQGGIPVIITDADVGRTKWSHSPAVPMTGFALETGMDEVQRISACMLGAVAPASLAHEAVLRMEMGMLRQEWPVGRSLGALPEVRRQLGLGRPAFREAVTILEARGLLDIRRGPGGGLFVAAPALEDIASAMLMYLVLAGHTRACIEEFRVLVWRMVVNAAMRLRVAPSSGTRFGQRGFAVDLASRGGNTTIMMLARLAETLVQISHGRKAPTRDRALEHAIEQGDLTKAFKRLDDLAGSESQDAPVMALDLAERCFSLSGRKPAMAMAVRMARELSWRPAAQEAEWETAERLGRSDAVVRQARRILQDFGIVHCRQGHKGAELASSVAPTSVIRLLAPCIVASATSAADSWEAICFLVSCAPVLAARRVKSADSIPVSRFAASSSLDPFDALRLENLLVEMSGNPILAIVVRSLGLANISVAGGRRAPPDRYDVLASNRRILQAIEAGDVRTAGALAGIKLETMQRPVDDPCKAA